MLCLFPGAQYATHCATPLKCAPPLRIQGSRSALSCRRLRLRTPCRMERMSLTKLMKRTLYMSGPPRAHSFRNDATQFHRASGNAGLDRPYAPKCNSASRRPEARVGEYDISEPNHALEFDLRTVHGLKSQVCCAGAQAEGPNTSGPPQLHGPDHRGMSETAALMWARPRRPCSRQRAPSKTWQGESRSTVQESRMSQNWLRLQHCLAGSDYVSCQSAQTQRSPGQSPGSSG